MENDSFWADPVAIGISAAFNQARNDFSSRDAAHRKAQESREDMRARLSQSLANQMLNDEARDAQREFQAEQNTLAREAKGEEAEKQRDFLTVLAEQRGTQAMEQIGARGEEARETKKVPPAKRLGSGGIEGFNMKLLDPAAASYNQKRAANPDMPIEQFNAQFALDQGIDTTKANGKKVMGYITGKAFEKKGGELAGQERKLKVSSAYQRYATLMGQEYPTSEALSKAAKEYGVTPNEIVGFGEGQ